MMMVALVRIRARLLYPAVAICSLIVLSLFYLDSASQLLRRPHTPKPPGNHSPHVDSPIPRLIWQIFFPKSTEGTIDKGLLHSDDWVSLTPGYTYTMVGHDEGEAIITSYFSHRPEILATFNALANPALKSDFLRYLILLARGGTYSDMDTKPITKPEEWIPSDRGSTTGLIIAVEYDEAQDAHPDDFKYPVQFCQWTIAAAPNHIVFERMVDRALAGLHDLAASQNTTIGEAVFSDFDVLNTTGPVAWTEVVFQTLQEMDPSIKSYEDLAKIRTPRYIGDVAVLPLESFRADYLDDWGWSWRKDHKGLVRHFFKGGWKSKPQH